MGGREDGKEGRKEKAARVEWSGVGIGWGGYGIPEDTSTGMGMEKEKKRNKVSLFLSYKLSSRSKKGGLEVERGLEVVSVCLRCTNILPTFHLHFTYFKSSTEYVLTKSFALR